MKFLHLLFIFFVQYQAIGQVISHVQQFPMNFHPGFAGEKGIGRVGGYFSNTLGERHSLKYKTSSQTYLVNYDDIVKKVGLGIQGVMIQTASNEPSVLVPHLSTAGGMNLYVAPKIFMTRKSGQKNFTLSPAISYSYLRSKEEIYNAKIRYLDGFSERRDYTLPQNSHKINTGILYSSKKMKLGFNFEKGIFNSILKQATIYVPYNKYDAEYFSYIRDSIINASPTYIHDGEEKVSLRRFSFSAFISHQFILARFPNFSITPFFYYQAQFISNNGENSNYRYGNIFMVTQGAMFQYKRILLGLQGGDAVDDEVLLGYSGKRTQIFGSFGFLDLKLHSSLSLTYLLGEAKL